MNQLSIFIINKSATFRIPFFFFHIEETKAEILPQIFPLSSLALRSHQYVWYHLSKIVKPWKERKKEKTRILCPVF